MRALSFAVMRVVACASFAACAPERPLLVRTDELMVYVILTPDTLISILPNLYAVVANVGTQGGRVEYVTADRFVMRRASDGAVFDWRVNAEPIGQYLPVGGNYVLSERGGPNGLGRRDLVAGETYTLQVVVGSRTIVGGVTIPSRPDPRVVVRPDGQRVVEWPRDSAAGIYELEVGTDFPRYRTTTDTFYVLREDTPGLRFSDKPRFQITAKDTNWYRYLRDNLRVRAGVQNGFGVVGAMSRAEILIPPP